MMVGGGIKTVVYGIIIGPQFNHGGGSCQVTGASNVGHTWDGGREAVHWSSRNQKSGILMLVHAICPGPLWAVCVCVCVRVCACMCICMLVCVCIALALASALHPCSQMVCVCVCVHLQLLHAHLHPLRQHPLFACVLADGACVAISSTSMPTCPTIDTQKYTVSSTGLRLVHDDQCEGLENVIADTDGRVRVMCRKGGWCVRGPRECDC